MNVTFRGGYVEDESGAKWWSAELLAKVEKERDTLKVRLDHAEADAEQAVCVLTHERDEARAETARLQEQVEWLLEGRRQEEQRLALEIDERNEP